MRFDDFARSHGLIVDRLIEGRWVRCRTTDKPRHRNGSYKFCGDIGWVQNWATSTEPSVWHPDGAVDARDMAQVRQRVAAHEREVQDGWNRAAIKAAEIVKTCQHKTHNYFAYKGMKSQEGLVTPEGALFVPMRDWKTNALVGGQVIRWMPEERKYDKRFIAGMRSKGAVFRMGPRVENLWLVEGYSTGLSVAAALQMMRFDASVVVTYSAGNLRHVAGLMAGRKWVFADNDQSNVGELAAQATGLPYVMSPEVGEDANDLHQRAGLYAVADCIASAMRAVPV